jgi:hypothetical protein
MSILCLVCTSLVPAAAHAPYGAGLQLPPQMPRECRFLSVWVEYPRYGSGMTFRDLLLNAQIAGLMKRELSSLGHHISEEPEAAYWSLMIMASNTEHRQFALSATLELRNLSESHNSGLVRYPRPGDPAAPTAYTALTHGSRRDLRRMVRRYVHQADAALLPMAQTLCMFEAHEEQRERAMERQVPTAAHEPAPSAPHDPWIPPLSDLEYN